MVTLFTCALPGMPAVDSVAYLVTSDKLTLAWDPPDAPAFGPLASVGYVVHYRRHGTTWWTFLEQLTATENPSIVVRHDALGDGLWDFAVQTVAANGWRSDLHSSVDVDASPFGGWHIDWRAER